MTLTTIPEYFQSIIDNKPDYWHDDTHIDKINRTIDRQLARLLARLEATGQKSDRLTSYIKRSFGYVRDDIIAAMYHHMMIDSEDAMLARVIAEEVNEKLETCETAECEEFLEKLRDMIDETMGPEYDKGSDTQNMSKHKSVVCRCPACDWSVSLDGETIDDIFDQMPKPCPECGTDTMIIIKGDRNRTADGNSRGVYA